MVDQNTWLGGPAELTRYEISAGPIETRRRRRATAMHRTAVGILSLVVIVAPIPFGGHQSVTWLAFTCFVALLGTIYFATCRRRVETTPGTSAIIALLLVLAFYSLVQGVAHHIPASLLQFGSVTPRDSIVAGVRLAGLALFAWVLGTALASEKPTPSRIARLLAFFSFVFVVYAAGAMFAQGISFSAVGGLTGPFANRNSFATFLGMGFLLALSLAMKGPSHAHTWPARTLRFLINWAVVATLAFSLITTQSRMGISATLVATLIVVHLQSKGRRISALFWVFIAFCVGLTLVGAPSLERFILLSGDWETRAQFYRQIIDMIAQRPLSGFGADSFAIAYEGFHAPPVSSDFVWDRAHSTYLKLWSELGLVIGTLPIIGGIVACAVFAKRCWENPMPASSTALGCFILVGLHATVDFSLEILANQLTFLLIVVIADYEHLAQQQKRKRHEK